mgnify:CR=1 FL=1
MKLLLKIRILEIIIYAILFLGDNMESQGYAGNQNTQQIGENSISHDLSSQDKTLPLEQSQIKSKRRILWIALLLGILFIVILVSFLGRLLLPNSQKNSGNIANKNAENQKSNAENEPNPKVEILATLPPEDPHILYHVLFDPYSHIAAYSIDKDRYTATSSSTIVVNGVSGKTYSESDHLTISPDGKRVAYVATQDDKEFVVVDGVEGKKYDYIKNLKFSPDGQHIAYAAGEGKYFRQIPGEYLVKTMFIVIDTTEGKKYDGTFVETNVNQTYDPFFSKDGKKVTYTAIRNGNNIIVVDDKEISDYSYQQYPQFIGSSYDLIYLASETNNYFLVVAGQKKTAHEYISDISGSPYYIGKDASQIAYEVTYQATDKHIRKIIVNDSTTYPIFSGVLHNIVFSNSGRYVAYSTGDWISKDLYVNGNLFGNIQSKTSIATSSPLFSPGEHLLVYSEYSQKEQNGTIHILSVDPLQKILDFPLKGFKVIGGMKFSDDGKNIYFKGWQGRKIVFVTLNIEKLVKKQSNK